MQLLHRKAQPSITRFHTNYCLFQEEIFHVKCPKSTATWPIAGAISIKSKAGEAPAVPEDSAFIDALADANNCVNTTIYKSSHQTLQVLLQLKISNKIEQNNS